MIESLGNYKSIFNVNVLLLFLSFILVVTMIMWLKKRGIKPIVTAGLIFVLIFLATVLNRDYLISRVRASDNDTYPYGAEAEKLLTSIVDFQVSYFIKNSKWAGLPKDDNVFEELGWAPAGQTHYAYYCGNDYIIPEESKYEFDYPKPAVNWPYGLYPDITKSGFVCMAIGNNDKDPFPDVWMINKFKKTAHLLDDATDKVLVDIVSEPFDVENYYASELKVDENIMPSRMFIEINFPAYRLDLYEDGRRLQSYKIAIGMRGYKSPLRNFYMERIEWNPWWIPPNAAWCKKTDEETGKVTGCKPVSPGPWNPLGPVKMILQSAILIHGTNKPKTIGKSASHGCFRMKSDTAIDLAWKVMNLAGVKQPIESKELYKARSRVTYVVSLASPVQVSTVYRRIEMLDNKLLLHPDVYKWQPLYEDTKRKILADFGLSEASFTPEDFALFLRGSTAKTLEFPIKP